MDKRLVISGIVLIFGSISIYFMCNTTLVNVQEFLSRYVTTMLGSFGIGCFIAGVFSKERTYYHYYTPIS
jgi:hypothetical protein